MVLDDLRDWEDGFDGEAGVAKEGDVEGRAGDKGEEDVNDEEGGGEVGEEDEVSAPGLLVSETRKSRSHLLGAHTVWLCSIARSRMVSSLPSKSPTVCPCCWSCGAYNPGTVDDRHLLFLLWALDCPMPPSAL